MSEIKEFKIESPSDGQAGNQDRSPKMERPALFIALILIGMWLIGRSFEAVFRTTVFDPVLVFWLGTSVWLLLSLFVVTIAIRYARELMHADRRAAVFVVWASFLVLLGTLGYFLKSYQIFSQGLFAVVSGWQDAASGAVLALFKEYPASPVVPLNLIAVGASKVAWLGDALHVLAWPPALLLGLFFWSVGYGTWLLFWPGIKGLKVLHLILAFAGVFAAIVLKATGMFKTGGFVYLHGGVVALLVFQALLTYASLRAKAAGKEAGTEPHYLGYLPPPAISMAALILFVLPVLADLQSQFLSTPEAKRVMHYYVETFQPKAESRTGKASPVDMSKVPITLDKTVWRIALNDRCNT
jgi:hypothetical protein